MEERTARVRAIEVVTGDVRRIDVEMVSPPTIAIRGGQFVSIRIGDGYHPRRSYSIASAPARTDGFELLVRNIGTTARGFFADMVPGNEIHFNGPMGFFTLADEHPGDVVLAATGVGISAILAQLHELLARPHQGRIELYWGFTDTADVFGDELIAPFEADPRFHCYRYVGEADGPWDGRVGFITDDVVAAADRLREPTFYLCGSGAMVHDVRVALAERQVPEERVRTEVFYPRV